jgi:hypothetical protein
VKIAFVVGFYDPVKTSLNACYPESVYADRIHWIAADKGSIEAFKGRFYEVVKTAEALLVCLGRSEAEKRIEDAIRGIVNVGKKHYQKPIDFEVFGNKYDPLPVVERVKSFGVESEPQIGPDDIRPKIPSGKILCMSLAGKTTIITALQRIGFSNASIRECFQEEVRTGARNSNLNQDLQTRARTYTYLLYAWEGLRHITPEAKKSFRFGCHDARSAAQVVVLFKKWITEGV